MSATISPSDPKVVTNHEWDGILEVLDLQTDAIESLRQAGISMLRAAELQQKEIDNLAEAMKAYDQKEN